MEENKKKAAPKKQTKKEVPTKTLKELGEPVKVPAIGQEDIDNDEDKTYIQEESSIPSDTVLEPKEVIEEIKAQNIEIPVTVEEIKLTDEEMKTISQIEVKLGKIAQGWATWLQYQKISPEKFLERYPNHKFKSAIEEIIAFQAKK